MDEGFKQGLFCLVFIVQLINTNSILEKLYPDMEYSQSDLTQIKLISTRSISGRSKRNADDCFGDIMTFNITMNEVEMTFDMTDNTDIDMNKPIYVEENGKFVPKIIPSIVDVKCFQDHSNNAAFGVSFYRGEGGKCLYSLEGTFSYNGENCVIHRSGNAMDGLHHVVQGVKIPTDMYGDLVILDDDNNDGDKERDDDKGRTRRRKWSPKLSLTKRQAILHKVELFIVTDSLVYDFWMARAIGATQAEKNTYVNSQIRTYYAYILNGIHLRYASINDPDLAINVLFKGILIQSTAASSTFSTGISTPNSDNAERPFVDSSTCLNLFTEWVETNIPDIAGKDHVMLFSRADFTRDGSTSVAGLAGVGRVCTNSSTSINEDKFSFVSIVVATHELGHSLDAQHDGSGNLCSAADKFIMSPSSGPSTDSTAVNMWRFSSCSVDYFKGYVAELNADTNNCLLSESDLDPNALDQLLDVPAGQFYSIDAQCTYVMGKESSLCRGFYNLTYDALCTAAYCGNPDINFCTSFIPGRGTSCGENKWCIDGACTFDAAAPGLPDVTDDCPHGDQPGIVTSDISCATLKASLCYQEYFRLRCCNKCKSFQRSDPDCVYGDKVTGCNKASCPNYPEESFKLCCATCACDCDIGGTCFADEEINPENNCTVCDPNRDPNAFSPRTDVCNVGGQCYNDGESDGVNNCQVCEVASGTDSLRTLSGFCFFGGVCYANGQENTLNPCEAISSTSQTTFSSSEPDTTQGATLPDTKPVVEPATTPVVEADTTPVVEPATTPVVEPATTQVVEPATTPVVYPATTRVVEPATTLVVEPATTQVVEPATTPVVEPATTRVVEPATTQEAKLPNTTAVVEPATTQEVTLPDTTPVVEPVTTQEAKLPDTTPVVEPVTTQEAKLPNTTPVVEPATTQEAKLPDKTPVVEPATTQEATLQDTTPVVEPATTQEVTLPDTTPVVEPATTQEAKLPDTTPVVEPATTQEAKLPDTTPVVEPVTTQEAKLPDATLEQTAVCGGTGLATFVVNIGLAGRCDISSGVSCNTPTVEVLPNSNLTDGPGLECRVRELLIGPGPIQTGQEVIAPATYVSCTKVTCQLPARTIQHQANTVIGWFIAVSNSDQRFGHELLYVPADSSCVDCTLDTIVPMCTFNDQFCWINGACYSPGEPNLNNTCEVCDIVRSTTAWSVSADACMVEGNCTANGTASPSQACLYCNTGLRSDALTLTDGFCLINGSCFPESEEDPANSCQSCQTSVDTSMFSPVPNVCTIDGMCYAAGVNNPNALCEECDPQTNPTMWSPTQLVLRTGGPVSCSAVCNHITRNVDGYIDFVCRLPTLYNNLFDGICYVTDVPSLANIGCTSGSAAIARMMAFCGYSNTDGANALSDTNVCP